MLGEPDEHRFSVRAMDAAGLLKHLGEASHRTLGHMEHSLFIIVMVETCVSGPEGPEPVQREEVRHREGRPAKARRQRRCRTTRGRCWRGAPDPGGAGP